tara:strand:+ start:118309 stop:118905 length:597 start_codon:yes stop_codon:yes gene_type:complete
VSSPQQNQGVGNAWLPLDVGTMWIYEGEDEGHQLREVVVAHELTLVNGIGDCTPLWHVVYHDGVLAERSVELLLTDVMGNVWLVGERSWDVVADVEVETEESWRADTHEIGPFLLMPADPVVGEELVHELPAGVETYSILNDDVSFATPLGDFAGLLEVEEQSEPDDVDIILYRPGTGIVHERSNKGSKVIVLHRRPG